MSAFYDSNSGFMFSVGREAKKLDSLTIALISSEFDSQADQDDFQFRREIEVNQVYRKFSIIMTLVFPIDLIWIFFLHGLYGLKARLILQTLIFKFLFKKINKIEFESGLSRLGKK